MKNIIHLSLILSWIIVGVFSAATASAYTFVLGPDSSIDTSGTNDVLRLEVLQMAYWTAGIERYGGRRSEDLLLCNHRNKRILDKP